MFKQSSSCSQSNSTLTELSIRQASNIQGSKTSREHASTPQGGIKMNLEHLVLRSGDKALQNMVDVFRRQLNEDDLRVFSGSRKPTIRNEYREYEQSVCTLLAPHWQDRSRILKKHVRRSLKPFRKSSGLLGRLLATPARITATACMMVLIGGYNADASLVLNTAKNQELMSPPGIKRESPHRSVIFVDASLPDLENLLSSVPADAAVVRLQPSGSLIGQMLDYLLQTGPTDSLHLFTHGASGQLQLGDKIINYTTLKRQEKHLNLLGSLLTGSRDIFVYGCQVAAGQQGNDFIHLLSTLTGADVAASDDLTGIAAKGGDWELELVQGNVNSRAIASLDYTSLLASGRVIAGDGSGGGGGGGGEQANGGNGGAGGGDNDTITGTAGDDILFGDGSGGGGGGCDNGSSAGSGGVGGGGIDTINGGSGNDILFGDGFNGGDGMCSSGIGGFGGFGGGGGGAGGPDGQGGVGGIGGGGGGGGYWNGNGGNGGNGGGGGGGSFSSSYGLGGGFNATNGEISCNRCSSGGGGGGYPSGTGGGTPQTGGNGGYGTYTTGGGNGGNDGGGYSTGGGGGGGFGGGNGGDGGYTNVIGSVGAAGGTAQAILIDDAGQTIYNDAKGQVGTLSSLPGGAGNDILDGGAGSDDLFGMGGTNTFVFEANDATTGSDIDTIYDFNNGTGNKISLKIGGVTLSSAEVSAIVGAQATGGSDRTIIHKCEYNKVSIVVKGIGRDLTTADFTTSTGGGTCVSVSRFPWTMFLPAVTRPKP